MWTPYPQPPDGSLTASASQLTLGLSRTPGQSSPKAPGNAGSQLPGLSLDCVLAERYTPVTCCGSQGDPGRTRPPGRSVVLSQRWPCDADRSYMWLAWCH